MALTPTQKASRLYKLIFNKAERSTSKEFFEENIDTYQSVNPNSIWIDFSSVPLSCTGTSGIPGYVTYFNSALTGSSTYPNSFTHPSLKNVIPFNYGTGYNYVLTDYLSNPIPFGTNDWLLDTESGVLTFYGGNPTNVSPTNPPILKCYLYTGAKNTGVIFLSATDGGSGGGYTNNYVSSYTLETYSKNIIYITQFGTTNSGASSININSLGTKRINNLSNTSPGIITDVAPNDLPGAGFVILAYDGTEFMIVSGAGGGNGFHGSSGTSGTSGATSGSAGSSGSAGVNGTFGSSGSAGSSGSRGTSGSSGSAGVDGVSGSAGSSGSRGSSGSSGANGITGSSGVDGQQGSSGTSGSRGSSGSSGITGSSGSRGTSGSSGSTGSSGSSGNAGTAGLYSFISNSSAIDLAFTPSGSIYVGADAWGNIKYKGRVTIDNSLVTPNSSMNFMSPMSYVYTTILRTDWIISCTLDNGGPAPLAAYAIVSYPGYPASGFMIRFPATHPTDPGTLYIALDQITYTNY